MTDRTVDTMLQSLLEAFPDLSSETRRTGRAIYDLLWTGHPVSREALATRLGVPTRDVVRRLEEPSLRCQTLYDDRRRVIGFGGLSLTPTAHEMRIGGQTLFTWCAWDTLFIPGLLGRDAAVTSTCPASEREIRLTVTEDGVPGGGDTVVSFVTPGAMDCSSTAEQSISCFCDAVRFFASPTVADQWASDRSGVMFLSVDDAFEMGRRYNAARFGDSREATGRPVRESV